MRAEDFVHPKSKIDYDIIDDIHAFMTNDNDFYRRNYFPVIDEFKSKGKTDRMRPMIELACNEYFKKFPLPLLSTKLSGSSPFGKNKKEICFSGCKNFKEFSAALNAALQPLSSPSKQITISEKNCPNNKICLLVSAVPRFATQFNI